MQLSLNFLPTPQPANPLSRLSQEQRAALVEVLARLLTKVAGKSATHQSAPPLSATKESSHD